MSKELLLTDLKHLKYKISNRILKEGLGDMFLRSFRIYRKSRECKNRAEKIKYLTDFHKELQMLIVKHDK